MIPLRNKKPNIGWTGGMPLKRNQARRSQRKRHASRLMRKMANWYEESLFEHEQRRFPGRRRQDEIRRRGNGYPGEGVENGKMKRFCDEAFRRVKRSLVPSSRAANDVQLEPKQSRGLVSRSSRDATPTTELSIIC